MGTAFTLGRIGEPVDTAALVAFLASDEAGFITGQVIYNNRGQLVPVGRAGSPTDKVRLLSANTTAYEYRASTSLMAAIPACG